MKTVVAFLIVSLACIMACGPGSNNPDAPDTADSLTVANGYDSVRAAAYGADDYGMRKYVMAFLRRGPNRTMDSVKAAELQAAHLQNITRLAEEGTLVVAGPFYGDGDLRGIYIFAVDSLAEAEALTNSDPAVQAGSLEMELLEWYGPAALMGLEEIHEAVTKSRMFE